MRRDVQAIILLLLGGAVLRVTWSDAYLNYVREGMRPFLFISAGLLLAFGAMAMVDAIRQLRTPAKVVAIDGLEHDDDVDDDHDDDHDHDHGAWSSWLLLLPVLAIFLIAPPALGAYSVARETTNAIPPAEAKAPPLPPGDPVEVTLSDCVGRAVWDSGLTLQDRQVRMTGFVTPNPAGGWWLARLSIACCAADAIGTRIQVQGAPILPANTWVTVTGAWTPGGGTMSADAIPILVSSSVDVVPEPRNPYE